MSRFDILGKEDAIDKIIGFIQSSEIAPIWNDWYVGVTNDPSRRLYEEHKASISRSTYVAVESEAVVRGVEKFLIEIYGMAGNPGGGENPRFVYAFKKTANSDPPLYMMKAPGLGRWPREVLETVIGINHEHRFSC